MNITRTIIAIAFAAIGTQALAESPPKAVALPKPGPSCDATGLGVDGVPESLAGCASGTTIMMTYGEMYVAKYCDLRYSVVLVSRSSAREGYYTVCVKR